MKFLRLIVLLFVLMGSCVQITSRPITEVSQDELKSVVLVDVRTPEEYAGGHLENALNINWQDDNFAEQFQSIGKDETIYVYCKKGGRSIKAQEKLISMGFENVVNLEGGYDAVQAPLKN
ncbi:rhodanese-like domain-containing protein [Aggregatimonas sangjinii]|uniref:Rhodanese-like domain-containing protein n=1 Tax=Aggregatimonas sangjinii TaxID=2583587 RepID=A0A5B7SV00_9FLAO|nr:rhodanese-like domain-containing protein [Aggregatimonas sangjinii]QCX01119.1 rhodanese-like domain-containing protein [Aggregatimonas sangjinii]